MNRFFFWQKWLYYTSVLFALFGVAIAIFGNHPYFIPYNQALANALWHKAELSGEVERFRCFISGPMGGTMACSYIMLAYIAKFPFKRKEPWARNAIVAAFGVWAIVDSAISIYYGVYFQAYLINVVSILQKALPIMFTWKDFKRRGY